MKKVSILLISLFLSSSMYAVPARYKNDNDLVRLYGRGNMVLPRKFVDSVIEAIKNLLRFENISADNHSSTHGQRWWTTTGLEILSAIGNRPLTNTEFEYLSDIGLVKGNRYNPEWDEERCAIAQSCFTYGKLHNPPYEEVSYCTIQ